MYKYIIIFGGILFEFCVDKLCLISMIVEIRTLALPNFQDQITLS